MNKNILIGVAIAVLVGVGFFIYRSQNGQSMMGPSMMNGDAESQTIQGTLQDLIAQGAPMQCTFSQSFESGESSGTVYVSGQNMKGDFMIRQADGTEVASHMVRSGDTTYTWSPDEKTGIMMKMSAEDMQRIEEGVEDVRQGDQAPLDVENENLTYACSPWVPLPGSFEPPADVEFTDFSAQMDQMRDSMMKSVEEGMDTQAAQCAACAQIPNADAQVECKKALGCQ